MTTRWLSLLATAGMTGWSSATSARSPARPPRRNSSLALTFGAGRFITGGQVYESASTGLPIVSVHDPENETSRTLADYPGWYGSAAMTADAIADAFVATAEHAARQSDDDRTAARTYSQRYSRAAQLTPRIEAWTERIAAGEVGR